MFGRILSALFSFAGWFVQSALVKFVVFFALYFCTVGFVGVIADLLPSGQLIKDSFSVLSPGVWYFLDLFKVGTGFLFCFNAALARFVIRRLPVIG